MGSDEFFYNWHSDGYTMDCIIHAFNFLVGHPYFQCREQVTRLINLRMHSTVEAQRDIRVLQGVQARAFTDVGVFQGKAYSLSLVR